MSRNDVIKSEPESPLDLHQDTLVYLTKLDDADFKLLYYFIDGQELAAASFRLDQKYTNNNNYIKLYARLCDQLTQKYGRPVSDEMEWSQTHYRDKQESLGFAYSLGHVATTKQWETPTTIITAVIGGEKLNVVVAIDYESKQHYERMETQKRKDTASMP